MTKSFLTLLFGLGCALGSCQQTAPATSEPAATPTPEVTTSEPVAPQPTTAQTEAEARAAVGRFIQTQPNAALYVVDSARLMDRTDHWQVLVPRSDWAKRMPNKAAFEVDKATGAVSGLPVK